MWAAVTTKTKTYVPSTVSQPAQTPATTAPTPSSSSDPAPEQVFSGESLLETSFLARLRARIQSLPDDTPEGVDGDPLTKICGDPGTYDIPGVSGEDLWEEGLNKTLKGVFGWGEIGDIETYVRRGEKGLDGLYAFCEYFINKRGVDSSLFEGKMSQLYQHLDKL